MCRIIPNDDYIPETQTDSSGGGAGNKTTRIGSGTGDAPIALVGKGLYVGAGQTREQRSGTMTL